MIMFFKVHGRKRRGYFSRGRSIFYIKENKVLMSASQLIGATNQMWQQQKTNTNAKFGSQAVISICSFVTLKTDTAHEQPLSR